MSDDLYFVPESIRPKDFVYPASYCDFVSQKASGAAIRGMPPWVFASKELWAMDESEKVYGQKLIPFAQAENMDMLAYFEVDGKAEPTVWVANPWDESVYTKCEDFVAWLKYAKEISSSFLKDHPQFKEKKFWYPDKS